MLKCLINDTNPGYNQFTQVYSPRQAGAKYLRGSESKQEIRSQQPVQKKTAIQNFKKQAQTKDSKVQIGKATHQAKPHSSLSHYNPPGKNQTHRNSYL